MKRTSTMRILVFLAMLLSAADALSDPRFDGSSGVLRTDAPANQGIIQLWPDGKVYYKLDPSLDEELQEAFHKTAAEWERYTCLSFADVSGSSSQDYIHFVPNKGKNIKRCSNMPIGKPKGEQKIYLMKSCTDNKRLMLHEFGHLIGMIEEHHRGDRDNFIKINITNIRKRWQKAVNKTILNYDTKGTPYDYYSIMHGPKNLTARQPELVTLKTTDQSMQDIIGKGLLSFYDLKEINLKYACQGKNTSDKSCGSKTCENNGYLDTNCQCICQDGDPGKIGKLCGCNLKCKHGELLPMECRCECKDGYEGDTCNEKKLTPRYKEEERGSSMWTNQGLRPPFQVGP